MEKKTVKKTAKTATTVVARDKEHLRKLIKAAIKKNGNRCDLNFIDVSHVTDMCEMFAESDFNGDISKWDVSRVTDMSYMFYDSAFQGDISGWNLAKVKTGKGFGPNGERRF